jgi:hypothetical protein
MNNTMQRLSKPTFDNADYARRGRSPSTAGRNPPGRQWQLTPPMGLVALERALQQKPASNAPPIQRAEGMGQGEGQKSTNPTGLPDNIKAGMENLSGVSLDDVKVHYNSDKPKDVQALATTQGSEIHLGPGQQAHLAHEAWHVVQQKQGRVRATLQLKGVNINDDSGLEAEADAMGARVLAAMSGEPTAKSVFHDKGSTQYPLQRAQQKQASTGDAIVQRRIDTRMPTRWYRGSNGSSSAKVNALITAYNNLHVREKQPRGEKLKEIIVALSYCSQGTTEKKNNALQIRKDVAKEWTTLVDMRNRNLAPVDFDDLDDEQLSADLTNAFGTDKVRTELFGLEPVGATTVTTYANEHGGEVPEREERNTVLYRPIEDGASLYHATKTENVASILKTGLDPSRGGSAGALGTAGEYNAPNYIYLGHSPRMVFNAVRNFDGFKGVPITVLKVNLPRTALLVIDPDMQGSAVRTTRRILPTEIEVDSRFDANHRLIQ